jgi:fucose permease
LLSEGRGFSTAAAATAVSLFWGGLMAGRVLAAVLPVGARPLVLLRAATIAACTAAAMLAAGVNNVSDMAAAALLGLACGPIFPSLIATTAARVGPDLAPNAIGFQIAAAAMGQSLLPAAIGALAAARGLKTLGFAIAAASFALVFITWSSRVGGYGRTPSMFMRAR